MEYKLKKENHDFWVERLKINQERQVCTNDVAFDDVEDNEILKRLKDNKSVLEIGCGNGVLYSKLSKKLNNFSYLGTDFVKDLVEVCKKKSSSEKHKFIQQDMTDINKDSFDQKYDFIITKRAIQNVLDQKLQVQTIDNLGNFLEEDGTMILVESSSDAQNRLNFERERYGLHRIIPPFHNLFFDDEKIKIHNFVNLKLIEISPFASDFYYITRLIYARYAKEFLNEKTNYDHPLEKIAISMANNQHTEKFSQIQTYIFKKNKL
jgi:SAM-dependent methyltransferase